MDTGVGRGSGSREGAKKKEGAKALNDVEALAAEAVDCGFHLHRRLGPGLFENVCEMLLADALRRRGYEVECQKLIDVEFDGLRIPNAFKADLLVEGALLMEVKSVERAAPVHVKQVVTYLRLMELPLGLLMNFGAETFRAGLKRVANTVCALRASSRLRENPNSAVAVLGAGR